MRITVKKHNGYWQIKATKDYQFSVLSVSTWEEAIRIADNMRTAKDPLALVNWLA